MNFTLNTSNLSSFSGESNHGILGSDPFYDFEFISLVVEFTLLQWVVNMVPLMLTSLSNPIKPINLHS